MKIFILLVLLLNTICFAQQNNFNKGEELQKFVERGGKVEEKSPNIYTLTYPDGISRTYNLNHLEKIFESTEGVDTTIINIWEIDTTQFNDYFSFWQKVQIANSYWAPLPVEDLDRNKRPELYGYTDFPDLPYPSGGPVRIFERDTDGIFKTVFEYDSSTIFVKAMGDIHQTGGKEIYIHSKLVNNGVVYRSDTIGVLPTAFDFTFYYTPNQINDMTFGDFDNNGITDCAFVDASNPSKIMIGEFRDSVNNFTTLYEQVTEGEEPSGFIISDLDNDGKVELISSTGDGNIYVIENQTENQYSLVDNFIFPSYNAYMKTLTNDIDKNGKLEFWIGGLDFEEGISKFQCYEADGNNSYKIVAYLELRYLVSLNTNYIQASDIDGDSKEELIISIGNAFLILKFIGSVNEHRYKLIYAKLNEATQPGAEFYPVAIADLDGDGKKDILLPFRKYVYPITYAFSYILRQDKLTYFSTNQIKEIVNNSIISYPTPFNATSTIIFEIIKTANTRIMVFNSLGEEIKILIENELAPGKYQITWDAMDKHGNSLPSGIYFIVLQTDLMTTTTKTILLK